LATITFKRPKTPFGGFDHTRPALLEADVLMQEDRLAAGTADLVHQVSASGIVQVGDHHLRAFTRQCRRTRCADT
jgi:hypothetical protein